MSSESNYSITEPLYRGNAHFDGETISVFNRKYHEEYTAKLADCQWFVGRRTWATLTCCRNWFGFGTGEALLIVFPYSINITTGQMFYDRGPAIAAVGLTIETRFQWEQAIERLNVERVVDRELYAPLLSGTFAVFWTLFSLAASGCMVWWIAWTAHHLLTRWNAPADITAGIMLSIIVGSLYIFFFLLAVPLFWQALQPTVYQIVRFARVRFVLGVCVAHVIILSVPWLAIGENDWTVRSAVIATAFYVVMCIILIAVYWRLLAEPRKDTAKQKPE